MSAHVRRKGIERWFTRLVLLAVVTSGSGCPFIVPTPGAQINAPAEDVVQMIKPQVTTRTDVLMMLGDPNFRVAEDRYFVYDWTDIHAVVGVAVIPYAMPLMGPLGHQHALGIEFAPDSRVARVKEFAKMGEQELWDDMRAWMEASDTTAR